MPQPAELIGKRDLQGRCIVHRRQVKAQRHGDRAAIPVHHGIPEADRAVVVDIRRKGPAAVAVIHQAAVAGTEVGDGQAVAIHIAEARQQLGGGEDVRRVFGSGRQDRGRAAAGGIIDQRQVQARGGRNRGDAIGDHHREVDRTVAIGRRAEGPAAIAIVGQAAIGRGDGNALHAERIAIDITGMGQQLGGGQGVTLVLHAGRQAYRAADGRRVIGIADAQGEGGAGAEVAAIRTGDFHAQAADVVGDRRTTEVAARGVERQPDW
ncbi:hypothetical protein D3C75_815710 [compost metagenome]